jgi:thiol:disulfide interchange protein DsbC
MTTLKKITALLLLLPSFYLIADEASLKKMIETSYPKYKVESVKKTPYLSLIHI